MSDADTADAEAGEAAADDDGLVPAPVETAYRTLGKPYRARRDAEMDAIGWSIFLGLLILLVPLLPLLILLWVVTKGIDILAPTGD